ncbi:MAG: FecR family protein [Bdellovibrionota bacterium]
MAHRKRTKIFSRLLVSTALAVFFLGSGDLAFGETEAGRLAMVNGDVRIAKSVDEKGRIANPNDLILNSDIIKTGKNSSAKLLFTDQSIMDVGADSALKVSDYALKDVENRTGTFSILYGKIRGLVTKKVGPGGKVEVRSADAVMGVRGTEFIVAAPGPSSPGAAQSSPTALIVVSGVVQVTPPAGGPPITVGAGQMIVATPAAFSGQSPTQTVASSSASTATGSTGEASTSPSIVKVSAEQVQSFLGSVKAEDNTFTGAVSLTPTTGSRGQPTQALANLSNLLTGDVALPPPSQPMRTSAVPEFLSDRPPMPPLPPSTPPAGNLVHLSVTVQ